MALSRGAQELQDRLDALKHEECKNGHKQSMTAYCVPTDGWQCYRYISEFVSPK